MPSYRAGQTLKFTYRKPARDNIPRPTNRADIFKEVLVLHPNWQGKLHAIDLKRLTPAEREVLDIVMDPEQRGKPQRLPLVTDILARMSPSEEIKNPVAFYSKFVRPFIRDKDCYRTYFPNLMLSVVVSQQTKVRGKLTNPSALLNKKPLFHKVESKPQLPKQAPQGRLDLIKQRAQASNKPSGVKSSKEPARPTVDRAALIKQRAELMRPKKPK